MLRKAALRIMLTLLLIVTLILAGCKNPSSSKGEEETQVDKTSGAGTLGATPLFSEGFEGAFPADNWLVQDESSNNGLDYWDDTSYRSHSGSWSGWCAQIGTQTTTILNENFEGAFPGSWTVEDFDSASGNDLWDYTSYKSYEGSRSAWCAQIGTKALPPVTIFDEGFEGAWPGSWIVGDSNANNDYDYWGNYYGKSYVGSWSGYCADEGSHPGGSGYDDNMDAYMYRNVSLSGYSSVTLYYSYWLCCEANFDYLRVMYYSGGSWYFTDQHTGNISAWYSSSVPIPTSAVYVGLHFHSDSSVCYYPGAFVDQVQLVGILPQVPNNSVHEYDNDMEAYMYHSVSLSGYSSATLSYYYWLSCEFGYDKLYLTYFDGSWHDIEQRTGSSGGWQFSSVSIPTSAIYVGFHFSSDASICNYEGAYIDQVILTADNPNTSPHTYDDYMDSRMIRKYTIDAGTWATATLNYWAWYQTETSYDYCQVMVTGDAGAHWYPVGELLTGSSGWSYHTLSIPDIYLTSLFNIGFKFHSDGSVRYEGVYLDDITIEYDSTIYIRADGSVDPPSAPIVREGNLYTLTDTIYTSSLNGIVIQKSNIVLDGAGYTLQGPGHAGELTSYGVAIQDLNSVTIRNMNIREFDFGVYVTGSASNIIQANNATDCDVGISLFSSPLNKVIGNFLTRNINYTIFLHSASDNLLQENNITDNDGYGIGLSTYSHRNNITRNTIAATDQFGVYSYTSFNTTLTENTIKDNYGGVSLQGSRIFAYHNNFINNSVQAYTYSSPSFWDDGYPSGGNYWGDYAGSDLFSGPYQDLTGSDGIGDSPYTIDLSNQDPYPLMEPWESEHISTRYDWPMFRCNVERNGYTRSPGPNNNQKLWSYTTGGVVFSSPAIVGRRVYVGSRDWNVYCLDALNGTLIWSHPTGGLVHSSPAVLNDKVYVGSYDQNVYCLLASTGELCWNYTTGGRVSSSPAVVNGKVYVGSWDNKTYCLDAETGAYIWSYTTGGPLAPSPPAVADGEVFVGSSDGRIYCLNAETGAYLWNQATGAAVLACPAIADGRVYIGSDDNRIYCLSAETGDKIWNYTTGGWVESSCAVADSKIYVGSADGKIYCLNAETGAYIWSYTTGGNITYSSPAISYGRVYVGSDDNRTYCLDASTGGLVWSYKTGGFVRSSPAIGDNVIYVGSNDGSLYAFGSVIKVPDDYPTIQAAIDAASSGDTIVIAPGIYYESIVISNKSLTIIGQRGSSTTFAGGGYGVAITISGSAASGTVIAAITITNYEQGILVDNSASCRIYDNIMYLMGDSGIVLEGSTAASNIIYGNRIYGNNIGINLAQTSGNIIYSNTISQNAIGIKLSDSGGNTIYMNSFIINTDQAMSTLTNAWDNDYPTGGNYWSDYTGTDLYSGPDQDQPGSDGIGDSWYEVSPGVFDRYPRMKPHDWIRPLGDANYDGHIDLDDLIALNSVYGSTLDMPTWNQICENCDFCKDNKIEVKDLYHLGKNYGLTYP